MTPPVTPPGSVAVTPPGSVAVTPPGSVAVTPPGSVAVEEPCYARNGITLYQGDCLEVFARLDPAVRQRIVAVISDPPYGIAYTVTQSWNRPHRAFTNRPLAGDQEPFDPAPWLRFPRVVLFGRTISPTACRPPPNGSSGTSCSTARRKPSTGRPT